MFYKNKNRSLLTKILIQFGTFLPDKVYLSLMYYIKTGVRMNWDNPLTYTEKLQWLKLYNRNPQYTWMVDKVKVKEYVKNMIGEEYVIPTIAVWDKVEDIDFSKLPNQFVLKCNHNSSSGICICKNKEELNVYEAIARLSRSFKQDYYKMWREWPYKNVERKLFAETFLCENSSPNSSDVLTDYKFFCFNGEPFMMYVSKDIAKNTTTDFFDMDYKRLPIRMRDPNSQIIPEKPQEFEKMKELAKLLSKGFPHIRVDFYIVNHHIYFGELTFYHNAGYSLVNPPEWNLKLGSLINLDSIEN